MDSSQFDKMFTQADSIMGPFADQLLQQAKFPSSTTSPLVVLDTACGSGVVTWHIKSLLSSHTKSHLELTCIDISEAMISNINRRLEVSGWDNVRAVQADAMDTKLPSSHFTHIFFNFGPFILPDGIAGLKECHRILKPNSILGCTTWKEVPWFADYRAGIATRPSLPAFPSDTQLRNAFSDSPERWDTIEDVRNHFQACGFKDLEVRVAENTTRMERVGDVEAMFPYTLGIMIQKFWTKEDVAKYREPAENAIMRFLREKYGAGPVLWKWVSIVATGVKA